MTGGAELSFPHVADSIAPTAEEVTSIASQWLEKFALSVTEPSTTSLSTVFTSSPVAWWKDYLALTWALRCVQTIPEISALMSPIVSIRKPSQFSLSEVEFVRHSSTLAVVRVQFAFETDIAKCFGVANLIPGGEMDGPSSWKAWTVFTEMGELKGHESDVNRLTVPDKEDVLSADQVDVLIIGAGQSGLQLAAALRTLSIKVLIVERGARVGDHWKRVYDFFKLHISKWNCQFAYRPWPASTPYYPSLAQIADFFHWYSIDTHLNVATSTVVKDARYSEGDGKWIVNLETAEDAPRSRTVEAGQLVFATGLTGWTPAMPSIPNQESYPGTIIHSGAYRNSDGWEGKDAVIVGAGCSAHDIAHNLYNNGAKSVTLVQRRPTMVFLEEQQKRALDPLYHEDGPPLPLADRLSEALPRPVERLLMVDSPPTANMLSLWDGLTKAGFKLDKPADLLHTIFNRMGGHYLDVGTSQLIVDGKIKVISGVPISSFVPEGLAFSDGAVIPADLVVFATGFSLLGIRDVAGSVLKQKDLEGVKEIWGLDAEGNVKGVYRDSGRPRLWFTGGPFPFSRYYSKVLALQILATQEGFLQDRFEYQPEPIST